MKVRIKFKKYGVMRFIGHLDIMRFFQKAIRRSGIDICYSSGFSPHQIMSFAAPLGVGYCSEGEYFDIEINSHSGTKDFVNKLNQSMVPGIEIVSAKLLPDGAKNAMASVAAAKYRITYKNPSEYAVDFRDWIMPYLSQDTIMITKQTKKSERTIDIKPNIYELSFEDGILNMMVDASSSGNIKPITVFESLCKFAKVSCEPLQIQITRVDTYLNAGSPKNPVFKPLEEAGDDF